MDPDSGVVVARTAEGVAVTLGLLKCGRIWLCPVCSAKIRNARAEEITRAVVAWIERGGSAYFVTFTARHAASDRLDALLGALQGTRPTTGGPCRKGDCGKSTCGKGDCAEDRPCRKGDCRKPCGKGDCGKVAPRRPGAYQRLITGGTWAGRPDRGLDGIRDRIGYVGMIRATEITKGSANGWHPHIHAIVFVGGRTEGTRADKRVTGVFTPDVTALKEWQDYWRETWTRALTSADPTFKPSDKHGVRFDALRTAADAMNRGKYIAKLQEGPDTINPANELARGDMKNGKRGSMAPFQILGRIGDLMGSVDPDTIPGFGTLDQCRTWWREYEHATKGRRAIEWTRYLRPLLGLDGDDSEETDLDLLFEEDCASPFAAGVAVESDGWHAVAGRALDLAVVESVEADDMAGAVDLVRAAGGKSGTARILGPGEVAEVQERQRAALEKRREAAAARRAVERAGGR